jgi:hypothetical protein
MTAEIIQFGKSRLKTAEPKAGAVLRALRAMSQVETEAIRCMVNGKLYEVEFRGKTVCNVCAVHIATTIIMIA